ncbi:hypothetical protein [Treponema brennaborense]|uniref:Lipoprotein n=1 Tax=Treponema brennaborense (strain DSM 12168 / CIP 105900 / DD5/3) TaxID=906968 RepID=F4LLU4_TREBD|nr:hypothetical protein [Treponema brennaborense]AEE15636.1 hypothetical protein Trebr_0185 [Treponema brennaborense DSM 12168]
MKRTAKITGAALAVVLGLCMTGCPNGNGGGEAPAPEDTVRDAAIVKDWHIAPGDQNKVDAAKLKIEAVTAVADKANCMKVTWSSSAAWKMCELYALLPADVDYGIYDGLQFDVKLPVSSNFLLMIRNPKGTTVKVAEDFVYRGTDDDGAFVWVTVKKPFADAIDTQWGQPLLGDATLKEWLTTDKTTQKQLNLNPVLNPGADTVMGEVDTDYVTYFDNIGFYVKGAAKDGSEDTFTAVWDFEK